MSLTIEKKVGGRQIWYDLSDENNGIGYNSKSKPGEYEFMRLRPSNYYGTLMALSTKGRFFWGVENYNGTSWEEIQQPLYRAIVEHHAANESEVES